MFFKRKETAKLRRTGTAAMRTPTAAATMSPRFARLVRESWWLLVVAAFVWLALVLWTYTRDDPAWSTSGIGAPIANKGGVAGAWLSDLLFYLFGVSAWWWVAAGIVLIVAGYRRIGHPERANEHPLGLGILGFGLVLMSSAALEALRLYRLPALLPQRAGGVFGDVIGNALARLAGFNGATLFLIVLFAVGWSLFSGMSWLKLMERIGDVLEGGIAWVRRRARCSSTCPILRCRRSRCSTMRRRRTNRSAPRRLNSRRASSSASSPTSASPFACWPRTRGR
jgi:S-DNA-T family DNA segregation ATPase FtsK/SpoIIIE